MSLGRSLKSDPLILPFYLPSLILSVSWGLLTPVMPLFAKELAASYALVGLVLSSEAFGMLLGDVPAGVLMRRLGEKETLLLGSACAALATAALFFAHNVPVAILLRLVSGFCRSLFSVSRHAYVADVSSVGRRGRAIALFGGLMRIGSFVGPLAGGVIAASYGLRSTFLVFGAANLAAMAVMALAVRIPSRQPSASSAAQGNPLLATLKERYRVLVAAGGGQLLAQTIRAGRSAIIPLYAADVIGLDVSAIGAIVSLASAIDMTLFYPAGLIMDRLGRKFAIVPSFLIQAVGMFLLPLTGTFASLAAVAALIGFGNGLGSGSMMTLGADLAPKQARGEFLGVWRLVGDIGHVGGPMIVGQVADLVALPTAAGAIGVAGLCAALVFFLWVPEPIKRRMGRSAEPSPAE